MTKKITLSQKAQATSRVWSNPWHFIAFGFGTGLLPVMPGTYGTVIAIPFYLLLCEFGLLTYLVLVALITFFGIWLSAKVSREIGIDDYPGMNFDEIVGYLVTMIAAPTGILWIILGFALFRLMDIWKPGPIRWVDNNVKGGFGVILDDLLAALSAWLILQLVAWLSGHSLLI